MIDPSWSNAQKARAFERLVREREAEYGQGQANYIRRYGDAGKFRWQKTRDAADILGERNEYMQKATMYGTLALLDSREATVGVVYRYERRVPA